MRAKFQVSEVKQTPDYAKPNNIVEEVKLQAVYKSDIAEDNSFYDSTSGGEITIKINNPAAQGILKPGKKFYIDFTEAAE